MGEEQHIRLLDEEDLKGDGAYGNGIANGNGPFANAYTASVNRQYQRIAIPAKYQRYFIPLLCAACVLLGACVVGLLIRPPVAVTVRPPRPKGVTLCEQSVHFDCGGCIPAGNATKGVGDWRFVTERDERNYGLTEEQCEYAFPGLFSEIDLSVRRHREMGEEGRISQRTFDEQDLEPYTLRGLVYDGELFLIENHKIRNEEGLYYRVRASLADLNRALAASQEPVPDVEFAMHDADFVDPAESSQGPYWTYTRKNSWTNSWLMPDFGFYSWPQPKIGTYQEVRRKMKAVDEQYEGLKDKVPQIFWRGNVDMDADLRNDLLAASKDKEWADIAPLDWSDKTNIKENYMPIEDHCKYAMLIHTEGRSYSGRLKYLQNCRSLIFAHKLQWIQPFEYLMVHEGPNQNYVEVERDFSDLEEKVTYFMDHPEEAQKIADNSVRIFRDRYTTPAANSCYWRKLLRGWSQVSEPPSLAREDGSWRGTPFESINLMGVMEWEPH